MKPIIDSFSNFSSSKQLTRLIALFITFIVIIGASIFAWDYFVNQKLVALIPGSGTTITIGDQSDDQLAISKQIASTSSKKSIRLRNGVYVVKFAGTSDYQEITKFVTISKSIEIKTPSMKYTDNKLNQLLESEKTAIKTTTAPILLNNDYSIDSGTLFEKGDWYGARLTPANWHDPIIGANYIELYTGSEDVQRIILKKLNGKWEIAAGPSVIFLIEDYPKIPTDVIRATNSLGFNLD